MFFVFDVFDVFGDFLCLFVFCVLCFVFVFVFCVLCSVRNTKIDMVCQMTDWAKNVFGVITK